MALASSLASSSTPACSCSDPQQRGSRGACTSKPSALSTRTVAALTSPKNTRWMQPCMNATRPRAGPRAGVTSGSRVIAARAFTGGASCSSARSSGTRPSRGESFSRTPRRCCSASIGAIARSRPGWVKRAKIASRKSRSRSGRGALRSICGRVSRISLSYWTPDGHAVTHAMQPRQRSKCVRISGDASSPSSWPMRMSTIRPRGESISSSNTA